MILIIGGMAQGKGAFAQTFQMPVIEGLERKVKDWMGQGCQDVQQALEKVAQEMGCEQDKLSEQGVVLVVREVGCGIVPMDPQEVLWRELTGRLSCILASHATEVYKVEAGIGVRIK